MALDWVDVELANLRAGFRWAADQHDLATAAAIAAHTAMLALPLERYEPVGWAEEILAAATAAESAQLPRLYTAASLCAFTGRAEAAVGYAHAALDLEADARYNPFDTAWSRTGRLAPISWLAGWTAVWRSTPNWPPNPGPRRSWGG
jgi:hypothetical protein